MLRKAFNFFCRVIRRFRKRKKVENIVKESLSVELPASKIEEHKTGVSPISSVQSTKQVVINEAPTAPEQAAPIDSREIPQNVDILPPNNENEIIKKGPSPKNTGSKKTERPPRKKYKKRVSPKLDYPIIRAEDLPDYIEVKKIYLIGDKGYEWQAAFKCPCGCGAIIQLNLLKEAKPCWRVTCHKDGTTSISPSVDRFVGCRSHFTITNSKIAWHKG